MYSDMDITFGATLIMLRTFQNAIHILEANTK